MSPSNCTRKPRDYRDPQIIATDFIKTLTRDNSPNRLNKVPPAALLDRNSKHVDDFSTDLKLIRPEQMVCG